MCTAQRRPKKRNKGPFESSAYSTHGHHRIGTRRCLSDTVCHSQATSRASLGHFLLALCTMKTLSYLGVFPVWLCSWPGKHHCLLVKEWQIWSENSFTAFPQWRRASQIFKEVCKRRRQAGPGSLAWSEAQVSTSCALALSKHSGTKWWRLRIWLTQ